MKTPWTVYLEFGRVKPSSSLRSRRGEYEKMGVEIIYEVDDRLTFRIECQGYGVTDAIDGAVKIVQKDVSCGLLPPPEGVSCHRSSAREVIPELLGLSEISARMDVSRQRVAQLAKQPSFPLPIAKLAMGPVFSSRSVNHFMKDWQRKAGRPRLPSYRKSMANPSSTEWRKAATETTASDTAEPRPLSSSTN